MASRGGRYGSAPVLGFAAALFFLAGCPAAQAQFGQVGGGGVVQPAAPIQVQQPQINSTTYQGSQVKDAATAGVLDLSLDEAIARGLKFNLGLILTSQSQMNSRGTQLQQLQSLLPTVTGKFETSVQQTNLE